jgi:hypothetical protein
LRCSSSDEPFAAVVVAAAVVVLLLVVVVVEPTAVVDASEEGVVRATREPGTPAASQHRAQSGLTWCNRDIENLAGYN